MQNLADIRSTFLNFFASNQHAVVESSPLVPRNDPTLMFTNSGMVQFKNVFTGVEKRPYTRATSAQKCVRAGGKHNDLENVGYTARHHTFFEMLGNFSFGDYFKEEAINYAWSLVTKHYGLNPEKLLVTVYHEDEEAAALWRKIAGLPDQKIICIKTNANFWRMADVGPCGPCTEIFIDQGPGLAGGPPGSPDEDGDRFLEFWNLVFMQFEEQAGGERVPLPKPSVDTGMGLERMAAIMQGVPANYEIDLFRNLIGEAEHLLKVKAQGPQQPSFRVIADHLRAMSFLLADGVMPSNEGRGYVLRRIMRRAMRHANLLGGREPVLYRLVPSLVQQMRAAYPELARAEPLIVETIKLEESRFLETLARGLKILDEETAKLASGQALAGQVAFKLYDTFGFPLDLTQDALRNRGLTVDETGFNEALAKQKAQARQAWAGSGEASTAEVWFKLQQEQGGTDFLGYSTTGAEAVVTALVRDAVIQPMAKAGEKVAMLCNQTPFYAESGGQVGDTGAVHWAGGQGRVTDCKKYLGNLWVHELTIEQGSLATGTAVQLVVDEARRQQIRANHSATHLLHEALRQRLGLHVAQKGSLVAAERLRFDISQPTPISAADLQQVEQAVNAEILANNPVNTKIMAPDDAIKVGAMALFGEKYGDEVRVVSMGSTDAKGKVYSIELCGGTHVRQTGEIGLLKIIGESAVAAGVRRIEAVTGAGALAYFAAQEDILRHVAAACKAPVAELPTRIENLLEERKRLEHELADLRRKLALGGANAGADAGANPAGAPKEINGVKLVSRILPDMPARELKSLADTLLQQHGRCVVALLASFEGKVSVVVALSPDLAERFDAVALVRLAAAAVGGQGGGGRPDMAQAGGSNPAAMPAALAAIEQQLAAA